MAGGERRVYRDMSGATRGRDYCGVQPVVDFQKLCESTEGRRLHAATGAVDENIVAHGKRVKRQSRDRVVGL